MMVPVKGNSPFRRMTEDGKKKNLNPVMDGIVNNPLNIYQTVKDERKTNYEKLIQDHDKKIK